MVATATKPAAVAAKEANYEAYATVVQLVSKGISEGITKSLEKLKDPSSFSETIQEFAANQGIDMAVMADPMSLYNGFWSLANGIDTDFRWRSSAGVPVRSALIASEVKPTQPPVAQSGDGLNPSFSIGVSAFGIGVGVNW